MDRGWVKLWRKSIDTGMLQNPELWTFWCWCLIKASHRNATVMIGFQKISLVPGQFIFGRNAASKELKMSVQTIRTCAGSLEKLENITIKSTNKFSIITITKWHTYNPKDSEDNQQINQQLTIKQPTTNHQLTTNKNVKNVKNEEKKERTPLTPRKKTGDQSSFALPDWIDPQTWNDFKIHRISAKARMTVRAEKEIISDLEGLRANGNDPNQVIAQSIKRGWRGVFELKGTESNNGSRSKNPPVQPIEKDKYAGITKIIDNSGL